MVVSWYLIGWCHYAEAGVSCRRLYFFHIKFYTFKLVSRSDKLSDSYGLPEKLANTVKSLNKKYVTILELFSNHRRQFSKLIELY